MVRRKRKCVKLLHRKLSKRNNLGLRSYLISVAINLKSGQKVTKVGERRE